MGIGVEGGGRVQPDSTWVTKKQQQKNELCGSNNSDQT